MSNNKVLFVAFQSTNKANGGVASMTEILKAMKGWDVHVITQRSTDFVDVWRQSCKASVIGIDYLPKYLSIMYFNFRILIYCLRNGITNICCNDIEAVIHVGWTAKLISPGVVFSIRGVKRSDEGYGRKWKLAKRFTRHFMVLSRQMKEELKNRLQIPEDKISFVYSIVNTSKYKPYHKFEIDNFKKGNDVGDSSLIIGIPAAIYPLKQQLEFIQRGCLEIMSKVGRKVKFYFLGDRNSDSGYYKKCLEAVSQLGLSKNVDFIGFKENMPDWYNAFDVTLVVSSREGLSRTMIESLSCGTPVVSFNVCSAKEILEGHGCGYVVEQLDYSELAEKIVQATSSEYSRLSANARTTSLELFQSDANAHKLTNLLNSK